MKPWLKEFMNESPALQIAPLIDVVFLLLIYFMVTSSLKKQEADLGILLPGTVVQSKTVAMPDEQIVEVKADGTILLNGRRYGRRLPDEERFAPQELPGLAVTLIRYRQAAESAGTKALVTIQSDDDAVHQRVVDVMNVCTGVGIKHVTFGMGS
jgi:biopolymer transport protein ExbD